MVKLNDGQEQARVVALVSDEGSESEVMPVAEEAASLLNLPLEVLRGSPASRSAAGRALAARPEVRLVVAEPWPRWLRGVSPGDRALARRLPGRLLMTNRLESAVPGAPFPDRVAILRDHPLFEGVPRREVRVAATFVDVATVADGEVVITEGRSSSAFWILLEGAMAVTVNGRPSRVVTRGGCVGGFSMLTGRPAAATVAAIGPVRSLVASPAQFAGLIANRTVELRLRAEYADRYFEDLAVLRSAGHGRVSQGIA